MRGMGLLLGSVKLMMLRLEDLGSQQQQLVCLVLQLVVVEEGVLMCEAGQGLLVLLLCECDEVILYILLSLS